MEEYPNLKNIHSKTSMQAMLEREAKKQMGGEYQPPVVSTIKDHEMLQKVSASNLPYLHKTPAI